jgi:hypothetical protein
MKQYDSSDSDMFVENDYSSNKIVASVNKNQNNTRVLRSNTRSVNYLKKSRKSADDSDGYESEATYSNLRTARSPTERKNSVVTRNGSKETRSVSNVRARKKVKFVSDDETQLTSRPEDFYYLIGTIHRDDEDFLTYKTMRIYVHRSTGNIVGERALILKDGSTFKNNERDPIHVRDLAILTEAYKTKRENLFWLAY